MRAAFYEIESTPPLGGFMWGHYQNVLATDVVDRLYIKAGVFEENGEYAAIVTADTKKMNRLDTYPSNRKVNILITCRRFTSFPLFKGKNWASSFSIKPSKPSRNFIPNLAKCA